LARAWPALDIHVPACDPQLQELVLAELDDYHPTAIQEPDDMPQLRAFFQTPLARDDAARALAAAFGTHLFVASVDVDDEDWAARSQASLGAVTVGRITVAPPWDTGLLGSPNLFVTIQPSMGFGTGHHATTRLMLGAGSAAGVDNDPDALRSAAENVERNAVARQVRLMNADVRDLASPADIVLANLTGGMLERYAATLAKLVAPSGHLIVSGVMDSESTVVPALERFLTLERIDHEDEWLCAVLVATRH
jgi:ribosomal protein L11 methylase PrmA